MTWNFEIHTQEHIGTEETLERAFVMLMTDKTWGVLVDGDSYGRFLTAGTGKIRAEEIVKKLNAKAK